MMFVFIQFCFHIICQSRIWCKGYEERLKILFPEVLSLTRLTHPNSQIAFSETTIIIKLKRICTLWVMLSANHQNYGNVSLFLLSDIINLYHFEVLICRRSSL